MDYNQIFDDSKEQSLRGRYIMLENIEPLLKKHAGQGELTVVGKSVKDKNLYCLKVGTGETRILMWSQMHGNESTATKALFDLFNFLSGGSDLAKTILESSTICFVPMLNPDGAEMYTRENASGSDLNRDFINLLQPESRALVSLADSFQPHYNFNLHDQRTIFGVADSGMPATISFLAPAYNETRDWNSTRSQAANVIIAMNAVLQTYIPGQIGRFDDSFNANCAGDNFQLNDISTVLIEAGHFAEDYGREYVRKYFFTALLSGIRFLNENVIVTSEIDEYLNIPQNSAVFFDFVYKNIRINYDGNEIITNFASQYSEELVNDTIKFTATIVKIGNLDGFFGHYTFDAHGDLYADEFDNIPKPGCKANFRLGNKQFKNGVAV